MPPHLPVLGRAVASSLSGSTKLRPCTVWAGNGSPVPKGREAPYDASREGRHHEHVHLLLLLCFLFFSFLYYMEGEEETGLPAFCLPHAEGDAEGEVNQYKGSDFGNSAAYT